MRVQNKNEEKIIEAAIRYLQEEDALPDDAENKWNFLESRVAYGLDKKFEAVIISAYSLVLGIEKANFEINKNDKVYDRKGKLWKRGNGVEVPMKHKFSKYIAKRNIELPVQEKEFDR